jgi:hypothetical protein
MGEEQTKVEHGQMKTSLDFVNVHVGIVGTFSILFSIENCPSFTNMLSSVTYSCYIFRFTYTSAILVVLATVVPINTIM